MMKGGQGKDLDDIKSLIKNELDHQKSNLDYFVNLDYDPRNIVGDDYNNPNDRNYGNPDCNGPDSFHGTHCAGIIAATRNNNIGMDGTGVHCGRTDKYLTTLAEAPALRFPNNIILEPEVISRFRSFYDLAMNNG